MYVRPLHMDFLLSYHGIAQWVRRGMLQFVLWDAVAFRRQSPYCKSLPLVSAAHNLAVLKGIRG